MGLPTNLSNVHILFVVDWFLKYASEQAVAAVRTGSQVTFVLRDHAQEFGGDQAERQRVVTRLTDAGVRVLVLPGRVSSAASWRATGRLRRTLAGANIDVCHAHFNQDPRLLYVTRGLPTVLTVHDPVPHPGQPSVAAYKRQIQAAWRRRAARLVLHGPALIEELPAGLRGKARVVPHGSAVSEASTPKPGAPVVAFLGRLEEYKGLGVLLEAMHLVWTALPEARLLIAGRGEEAVRVPVDSRIELITDLINDDEFNTLIKRSSVIALPYLQASASGVGSLAIGLGVPLVVSDQGTLASLVVDPRAVVAAGSPAALAEALICQLAHTQADRDAVLLHARNTLSWDVAAAQSLALYRELVPGAA